MPIAHSHAISWTSRPQHLSNSGCASLRGCARPRASSARNALGQMPIALPSLLSPASLSMTVTGMPTCRLPAHQAPQLIPWWASHARMTGWPAHPCGQSPCARRLLLLDRLCPRQQPARNPQCDGPTSLHNVLPSEYITYLSRSATSSQHAMKVITTKMQVTCHKGRLAPSRASGGASTACLAIEAAATRFRLRVRHLEERPLFAFI